MTANDTEGDGEAHASAGLALGGEEGIEETLFDFGRHAGAGVANADYDAVASLLDEDANLAAGRHCIAGVVDHVDEHFTQLDGVAFDVCFAVGMEYETNGSEFGARLPFGSRHFAGIFQEFGEGDIFKLAARTLAREVLDATNDVSA